MGKKCIPGIICIENMTLFLLFVIFVILGYIYFSFFMKTKSNPVIVVNYPSMQNSPYIPPPIPPRLGNNNNNPFMNIEMQNTRDIFNDPYVPPVKRDDYVYKQMGILTIENKKNDYDNILILPLMGKQHINGRDKWNYYTISNTGSLNTKLPVRVKGKVCTNEYGCDQIFNGDIVFVDGYEQSFKTTIYENNGFNYSPF